ncbi:MAG: hypothetical protein WCP60_02210 [bacterium]
MNPPFTRTNRFRFAIMTLSGILVLGIMSESNAGPTPTPTPSPTPSNGRAKKAPPSPPNVAPYSA